MACARLLLKNYLVVYLCLDLTGPSVFLFAPHGNAAPSPLVPAPRICGWVHLGLLKMPPDRHWTPPGTPPLPPPPHTTRFLIGCVQNTLSCYTYVPTYEESITVLGRRCSCHGERNGTNSEFIRQGNQIAQPCLASPRSHLALPEQCRAKDRNRRTWEFVIPRPGGAALVRTPIGSHTPLPSS